MVCKGSLTGALSGISGLQGSLSSTGTMSGSVTGARDGTRDYNALDNKPSIEGHVLVGDKTFKQLGLDTLSEWEIEKILYLD